MAKNGRSNFNQFHINTAHIICGKDAINVLKVYTNSKKERIIYLNTLSSSLITSILLSPLHYTDVKLISITTLFSFLDNYHIILMLLTIFVGDYNRSFYIRARKWAQ